MLGAGSTLPVARCCGTRVKVVTQPGVLACGGKRHQAAVEGRFQLATGFSSGCEVRSRFQTAAE